MSDPSAGDAPPPPVPKKKGKPVANKSLTSPPGGPADSSSSASVPSIEQHSEQQQQPPPPPPPEHHDDEGTPSGFGVTFHTYGSSLPEMHLLGEETSSHRGSALDDDADAAFDRERRGARSDALAADPAPRVAMRRPSILAAAESAYEVPAPRVEAQADDEYDENSAPRHHVRHLTTSDSPNANDASNGSDAAANSLGLFSPTRPTNTPLAGESELNIFSPTRPVATPLANAPNSAYAPLPPLESPTSAAAALALAAAGGGPSTRGPTTSTGSPPLMPIIPARPPRPNIQQQAAAAGGAASSTIPPPPPPPASSNVPPPPPPPPAASSSSSSSSSSASAAAAAASAQQQQPVPYSRRQSLLNKSHLNFKTCLKHQFPLIDAQVGAGQALVKRVANFLKRVCEMNEAHSSGILKLTVAENEATALAASASSSSTASRDVDKMLDHIKATTQVFTTIEALAARDLAFAQKMNTSVVKPLMVWIPIAEEKRAKLVKDEKTASANMFAKNSDAEKIRLAGVKSWAELGAARKDREKEAKSFPPDAKALDKAVKKVVKLKEATRSAFMKFEALKDGIIARTVEYRNVTMPSILSGMEELEKDRLVTLKRTLYIYAQILREATGAEPSPALAALLPVFEGQLKLLSSSVDMNRCIEGWINAHGLPPADPQMVQDLPCASEHLAPESNAWEAAITHAPISVSSAGSASAAAAGVAAGPASPMSGGGPFVPHGGARQPSLSNDGDDAARGRNSLPPTIREDGDKDGDKDKDAGEDDDEDDEDDTLASTQMISESWYIAKEDYPSASASAAAAYVASTAAAAAASSASSSSSSSSAPVEAPLPLLQFQVDDIIRVVERSAAGVPSPEGWWVGSLVSDMSGKIGRFPRALVRSVDDKAPPDVPVVPGVAADGTVIAGPSLADLLRSKVSKKKKRFQQDGFDLDLTYILPNIIAMGFPSEGLEGQYRNHMLDVQRFFIKRHPDNYKLYNLCSERWYEASKFDGRVSRYPFDDHNPTALASVLPIMQDIHTHLNPGGVFNPNRVAAIHCKAGKGRTGFIICCYLLYMGLFKSYEAELALRFYAVKRTKNQKGVTIPSQIRYVMYFARWLRGERGLSKYPTIPLRNPVLLQTIRLVGIPRATTGKDVWFKLVQGDSKYSSKGKASLERRLGEDYLMLQGASSGSGGITSLDHDCHITFFTGGLFNQEKLFQFWFNTRMLGIMESKESNDPENELTEAGGHRPLILTKAELDKACKDVHHRAYVDTFRVELIFAST